MYLKKKIYIKKKKKKNTYITGMSEEEMIMNELSKQLKSQNLMNDGVQECIDEITSKYEEIDIDVDIITNMLSSCMSSPKANSKTRDPTSLSFLVDREMTQSQCIRLGIEIETTLRNIIIENTSFVNIRPKNKKGNKERDHLFCDHENKTIYYAELKANINLDTEKSKSTYKKCLSIVEELKIEYPEYDVKWCLLAFRYIDNTKIPNNMKNKYASISENLFGINDYFKMLGLNYKYTERTYKNKFINTIATHHFFQ